MLKKGQSVVYAAPDGISPSGMEYGVVESVHGEWVAVKPLVAGYTRSRMIAANDHAEGAFVVVPLGQIVFQDVDATSDAHVQQQAKLFVDAFMRGLDGDEGADVLVGELAQRLHVNLLKMHAIGFLEGQGVTVSEPWEWAREGHRIASAFTRYHDFCATQENRLDESPDASRLCEFLVWAKGAIRGGGAVASEQAAMVYCATSEARKEGSDV